MRTPEGKGSGVLLFISHYQDSLYYFLANSSSMAVERDLGRSIG
jgi:hypothetical protein